MRRVLMFVLALSLLSACAGTGWHRLGGATQAGYTLILGTAGLVIELGSLLVRGRGNGGIIGVLFLGLGWWLFRRDPANRS